ncbi:YkgJ family cysteine cluster protein [Pleomorphochaeta sp. DL1XJH-081]|uniref:YkgJ family cysteine cluster protein n=1 Tax=Pleomorphochaeta sp. DL1XJH-081 TaxID=3409690 RepID=UPI003BB764B2
MGYFYDEGLQFTCQPGCRYCCGVEPGYVFLTKDDLTRLTDHFGLSSRQFLQRYCRKVPMGSISYISLLEKDNHDCVFLASHGCSVYEVRPVQCATYPFWNTIIQDRQSWEREASWCPGIGIGELHGKAEIDRMVSMREGVEPAVWEDFVD